jgi:hypothetical protein
LETRPKFLDFFQVCVGWFREGEIRPSRAGNPCSGLVRDFVHHLLDEGVVFLPCDEHGTESIQCLAGLFFGDKAVSKLGNCEIDNKRKFCRGQVMEPVLAGLLVEFFIGEVRWIGMGGCGVCLDFERRVLGRPGGFPARCVCGCWLFVPAHGSIFEGEGSGESEPLAGWGGTLAGECALPQETGGTLQEVESEVQVGPEQFQQADDDGDKSDGQVPDSFQEPGGEEDVEELHDVF